MSDVRYGIRITPESIDLVTYLNDGVRPEINEENYFLIVQVNGPCEITSKVMPLEEYNALIHKDKIHEVF